MTIASDERTKTQVRNLASFPGNFAWGLATAAYQIEGAAFAEGRGPSIWDTFAHTPGLTLNGDNGDVACNHYRLWRQDLDLLASLGVKAYRLSVSWSRLQPAGSGPLNPSAVAFYRNLLQGLKDRGIEPYVTLYHWDLPQELEDAGGWPARATAERFAQYAELALLALGDLAENWITINEPWCVSFLGYGEGAHAPGRKDMRAAVAAAHHLNLAHGLAVQRIRAVAPTARVGITNIVTDVVAESDTTSDRSASERLDAVSNRVFLDPVYLGSYSSAVHETLDAYGLSDHILEGDLTIASAPTDFAGVNHYQRVLAAHDPAAEHFALRQTAAEPATTSFGWSVTPDALTSVLRRVAADFTTLPIYITESGASFHDYVDPTGQVSDPDRIDYLSRYFEAAADAINEGIDLRGYFVWSFLDNFEWAEGYSKRFGIVYVDYRTQARIPKQSAHWYAKTIAEHSQIVTV